MLSRTYLYTVDYGCVTGNIILQVGIQSEECKRNKKNAEYYPAQKSHYAFSYCQQHDLSLWR